MKEKRFNQAENTGKSIKRKIMIMFEKSVKIFLSYPHKDLGRLENYMYR
jgi:hypothetical protein